MWGRKVGVMSSLDKSAPIGFAGLGNLGLAMATGLIRSGWQVTAYDIRQEPMRAWADAGGRAAASVDELADCQILALVVPDDDAVTGLLVGERLMERLPDGAVVAVHSTILPATARKLGELAAEHGVHYLDVPVSGGAERAEQGTLTVMAGADPTALRVASAYLDTVAADVVRVGPPGAGAAAKLANQLMMFAALAGTHEAIKLAAAYDVDTADVLKVAGTSTGDSWVARTWGFFDDIAAAYDAAGVPVRFRPWSKDLWDVVAAARAADINLPVAGLLAQTMVEMVESKGE